MTSLIYGLSAYLPACKLKHEFRFHFDTLTTKHTHTQQWLLMCSSMYIIYHSHHLIDTAVSNWQNRHTKYDIYVSIHTHVIRRYRDNSRMIIMMKTIRLKSTLTTILYQLQVIRDVASAQNEWAWGPSTACLNKSMRGFLVRYRSMWSLIVGSNSGYGTDGKCC